MLIHLVQNSPNMNFPGHKKSRYERTLRSLQFEFFSGWKKRLLSFMKKMTTFSLGGATQGSLSHLECNTSAEAHL